VIKRIVTGILTLVLSVGLLCGCSTFIGHDTERDMKQVVARVEAYDIGDYRTQAKDIYKLDLVEYVDANYSSISSSVGNDTKAIFDYAANSLVNIEIIMNEVEALIAKGDIKWGLTQDNAVKKRVYSVIDSTLMSLRNEILEENGEEGISTDNTSDSTSTTYPVKPDETDDDDKDEVEDTEEWEPELARYPGLTGDQKRQSLDKAAMRRFIALIKSRVEDDFRLTAEDRARLAEDDKKIDEVINTRGIEYVYPMIGGTRYMSYISGDSIVQSQKITLLQEYLNDSVTVSEEDVIKSYDTLLKSQRETFSADISAFDTAIKDDSTTVVYYPNNNYFYVKHILLPFSDEQKTELSEYKSRIDVNNDDVEQFRARLAEGIVCYPHVDGEDDKTRPMSVDGVINDIKATMLPLESSVSRADVAFDDLIYKYNTDKGAFGNNKGYIVKYKLDDGEDETYMQEFADAARYMRENVEVGKVYYEKVITDYGVHIMYMASVTEVGEVPLYSYTTPGRLQTYYELLEEPIKTRLENEVYGKWERDALSYNFDKHVTLYEDTYKDLWED